MNLMENVRNKKMGDPRHIATYGRKHKNKYNYIKKTK